MLSPGDLVPPFEGQASDGRRVTLASLRGQPVVVYFFFKAFTPNCTVETKGFRDNYPELRGLGVEVVGVSTDSLATQCDFAEANAVSFPMIADSDKRIGRAFGVLWPILGLAKRVTFVIDEVGVIRHVFHHEVQISKHLDDVLRVVRKMKAA